MPVPLTQQFLTSLLLPGDILLYDKPSFANLVIKLKRGEKYSHCEIYDQGSKTVASRNGIGVRRFELNFDGLAAIYRVFPDIHLDLEAGRTWFTTVDGQGYDWFGLLSFTWAKYQGRDNGKMFCSEFIMRFYQNCLVYLFAAGTDADSISPGLLPYSPRLFPVWLRQDKRHAD